MENRTCPLVMSSLILSSFMLSGCLSSEGSGILESEGEPEEEFQGMDYAECMIFEELERCWNVFVPSTVNITDNVPLIIDLHGNTVTMQNQRILSEFDEIAENNGVMAVWPQGHNNSWNAGYCCSTAGQMGLNDTGFILDMIEIIALNHSVDVNRIYLTGWSNGCIMSQRMALQASNLIAAVACTSGYLGFLDDSEYIPIPIMEMHGVFDEIAQYSNSVRIALLEEDSQNIEAIQSGAHENLYDWANFNGCEGLIADSITPNSSYTIERFTSCENNSEVVLFTSLNGGHNLYENDACDLGIGWSCWGNQGVFDTHQIIWDFVSRYSKNQTDNSL